MLAGRLAQPTRPYLTERLLGAAGGDDVELPGSGILVREMINSSYQVYAVG